MSPLAALLLTLGMCLVPSVLFLGLWRGLTYPRDDELVEETRRLQAARATDPMSAAESVRPPLF